MVHDVDVDADVDVGIRASYGCTLFISRFKPDRTDIYNMYNIYVHIILTLTSTSRLINEISR